MVFTQQQLDLLKKRYLWPGEDWSLLCRRVAKTLANNESEEEAFFDVLYSRLALPNTPTLINAGKPDGQFSACFLLPIEDSIDSIFGTLKDAAKIYQTGGGVGFNFSAIRPEGFPVKGSNGIASGPISFMKVYDAAIQQMKQGGVRRGAAIALLSIDHPDIIKFITCKQKDKTLSNFNISVAITDEFMSFINNPPGDNYGWNVKFQGKNYYIRKQDNQLIPYEDWDGTPNIVYSPLDIWALLCSQARHHAEPGVLFIDTVLKSNKEIQGVNPCGEVPLRNYESCCLGSIDVSKFVYETGKGYCINFPHLTTVTEVMVTMLNRIIDKSTYPMPEIAKHTKASRKIGLGIMGWADMLLMIKMRYGSSESLELAEKLMKHIQSTARSYSAEQGYKNETVTTIAPTGSLSLIAGCSSGIEPIYRWETLHHREGSPDYKVVHPMYESYLQSGHDLPPCFVTADQITPEEHVRMQAAFQKYVDNAISKTVNLPDDSDDRDVETAYLQAYRLGCKGVTVYRDGSKENQVLSEISEESKPTLFDDLDKIDEILEEDGEEDNIIDYREHMLRELGFPKERPYCLQGYTFKIRVDMGNGKVENAYINVNCIGDQPYEVFLQGKVRDIAPLVAQVIDSTTRLASLALRNAAPLEDVIDQLEKINATYMYSIPHKVAQILREFLGPENFSPCPDCGGELEFSEGCMKCSCGWSKCG